MPKSRPLKLIIDTNLWISFIISHKQDQLDTLLFDEKARLLFSTELIDEIQQTIIKPKLKNILAQMLFK
jgi:putative PIN family toxin of toxin-antitoxin system